MSAFFSLLGRGQSLCLCWNKNKALPLVSHSFSYFISAGKMRKMIKMTPRVIKTFNGQMLCHWHITEQSHGDDVKLCLIMMLRL